MRVVFVDPSGQIGSLVEERLDDTSERHLIALPPPPLSPGDPIAALEADPNTGLVVALAGGCPTRSELTLLRRGLNLKRRVWLHWPEEGAVECATPERLESYRRHWLVINLYQSVVEPLLDIVRIPMRLSLAMQGMPSRDMPKFLVNRAARVRGWRRAEPRVAPAGGTPPGQGATPSTPPAMVRHAKRLAALREARRVAKPIPFPVPVIPPDERHPISGCGVYMRTDFWAPIVSGGSYGHTCYVAKELAAVTHSFVCFMANRFPLLDEYGIAQIVMPQPSATRNEEDMVAATPHYLEYLRPQFEKLRPAYIYERLCVG